jgi:hypothetical protein
MAVPDNSKRVTKVQIFDAVAGLGRWRDLNVEPSEYRYGTQAICFPVVGEGGTCKSVTVDVSIEVVRRWENGGEDARVAILDELMKEGRTGRLLPPRRASEGGLELG